MTDEELAILRLLAEGNSLDTIARRMGCCRRTVQRRLARLLDNTGCRSYTHLAVWATLYGYVDPDLPPRETCLGIVNIPDRGATGRRLRSRLRIGDSGRTQIDPRIPADIAASVGGQRVDDIEVKGGVL